MNEDDKLDIIDKMTIIVMTLFFIFTVFMFVKCQFFDDGLDHSRVEVYQLDKMKKEIIEELRKNDKH